MVGRWRISNQDGMTVMAIALIFNFLFIVILLLPRTISGVDQSVKRTIHYSTIQAIRNNIKSMLTDSSAWGFSKADSANGRLEECYSPPYPDCAGFSANIRLRDSANEIYYDNVTTDLGGFDLGAERCQIADNNPNCIFSASIVWTPRCVNGVPCVQPLGQVEVKLSVKVGSMYDGVWLDTKPWDLVWDVQ